MRYCGGNATKFSHRWSNKQPAPLIWNHMESNKSTGSESTSGLYDFSGPLWRKYYEATRRNVRFPRGYKEVSLFDEDLTLFNELL